MANPFQTDENGMALLYHRQTGKVHRMWPVDAREILTHHDQYSTTPVVAEKKSASEGVINIGGPATPAVVEPRPDLTNMGKAALLNYSKKIGLDLSITLVSDQIVEAIQTQWKEIDEREAR